MTDLFARSAAGEPGPAERARAPQTGIARPIHISGYDRQLRDFYATPDWVTEALLRHVQFRGRVWEPCCGTGAVSPRFTASRARPGKVLKNITDKSYTRRGSA